MADEKRKQVAKHGYLDAKGQPTKKIEEAASVTYQDVATGKTFTYDVGKATPATILMLAIFGAKTKATNEASAYRQDVENGKDPGVADQIAAIEDAFLSIDGGIWREPGEARGPKYDNAVLAVALVAVLGALAKGDSAHYLQRLEEDKKYRAKVVSMNDVKDAYWAEQAKRGVARPTVSKESLA